MACGMLINAYKHKTYDYRSFSDRLYGKTRYVMSNLFEITYLIMIGTASAAAFATGGSTLNQLLNIPYWLCTLIVAAFIFLVAMFGTNVVRKTASTLSVLIIVGLVVVLVPNIIAQFGDIQDSIGRMAAGEMVVCSSQDGSFLPALWSAVLYFLFQLASVSVMYQHMEPVTSVKQINHSAIWMFVVNSFAMMLSIVGLLAVGYVSELADASVPMLVLVQNGVGSMILTPIISILIILGAVSTGVNMVGSAKTEQRPYGKDGSVYRNFHCFGFRHCTVRSYGSSTERLRIPGICLSDHSVYPICDPCHLYKNERNLRWRFYKRDEIL